ncbi:MAG: succinate CoA transferase [Deltaproteobacteria bacterium]|nr:succinate CoA transferase [Deltaproteobacteria bacterium]
MVLYNGFPVLSAAEAAEKIGHGSTIGFSGFTPAGSAKIIPKALAERAVSLHARNEPFKLRVLAGASAGRELDTDLAEAEAIAWRTPYQSSAAMRKRMNAGTVDFFDMHLSHMPQMVAEGFLGKIDYAVAEATDITADGRVFLTTSIGATPTFLKHADKILIELNHYHSPRVSEMADIATLPLPPHRSPIAIFHPMERVGWPFVGVDPKKVIGIVENNQPDGVTPFDAPDAVSRRIAMHVIEFLLSEMAAGRIPKEFLPIQSGVGNIANAVLSCLRETKDVPQFHMYTEVMQDSVVDLMKEGIIKGVSTTALTVSDPKLKEIFDNIDFFQPRVVLRPQEFTNNPGIVRRLGVITTNTALEVDIYGHVNSTHVCGTQMMNGLGGSGDFTRNAYISVFMCPSIARGGRISTIVPMCSHVDHSEHSVQAIVTEYGVADLRGQPPEERARRIIDNCAHPAYRDYLHDYIRRSPKGHLRHDLTRCFELHTNLMRDGAMLPGLKIEE